MPLQFVIRRQRFFYLSLYLIRVFNIDHFPGPLDMECIVYFLIFHILQNGELSR